MMNMNLCHWATAALAIAAISVQGSALPTTFSDTRRLPSVRPQGDYSSLEGRLYKRQEPHPTILYRGGENTPQSVKEQGGFIPSLRGQSGQISNATFGLKSHHLGENRTLYTSTTRSIVMAGSYALQNASRGFIYRIHATPNMIDLDRSGFDVRFKREEEFSALGGVRYDQIEAWAEVTEQGLQDAGMSRDDVVNLKNLWELEGEFPTLNFTSNPDYDHKYDNLSASCGQPQLAGDEANLAKYGEKSLEGYAIEFMEKNGAAVGWDGKFPLSSLKAVGPSAPEPADAQEPVSA